MRILTHTVTEADSGQTVRQLLGERVVRFEELAENISSFFIHTLDISGVVNALANCIFKYIRIRNL